MSEKRNSGFGYHKFSLLDRILLKMRLQKLLKHVDFNDKTIVDVGCGYNALTLQYIKDNFKPKKLIAVDLHLNKEMLESQGIECIEMDLEHTHDLGIKADVVIATAIIEHITNSLGLAQRVYNTLVSHGVLLMTVPSVRAQPVLEFMAYKLRIIDEIEIRDHKLYYNKERVKSLLQRAGFQMHNIKHNYFQLFMNNFGYAQK